MDDLKLTYEQPDRIRGCAVGAACGDALGMPLEFETRRPIEQLVHDMYPGRLEVRRGSSPGR